MTTSPQIVLKPADSFFIHIYKTVLKILASFWGHAIKKDTYIGAVLFFSANIHDEDEKYSD